MSAEIKKVSEKKKSEISPVNTKDDALMVREGLRLPLFVQNPEWHKKTPQEKAELEMFPKIKGYRASAPSRTLRTCKHGLTVHLKNLKKVPDFKTTYSVKLYQDEILGYLHTFFDDMAEEVKVVYYHGKVFPFFS